MEQLWWLLVEIEIRPGDLNTGSSNHKGFVNVVTWAISTAFAEAKIASYLATFDWCLVRVEESAPIDEIDSLSEALYDLLDRARDNPAAIILGTFHSYPIEVVQ